MKPVIALVGGVASGKSAVARAFEKRGALVVDADKEGHEVLKDPQVKKEIAGVLGADVLDNNGEIDRVKVGAKVFGDEELLQKLNGITHPRIRQRTQQKIDDGLNDPKVNAVVLDISLLLESGAYNGKYSLLVFVEASEATRESRAASKRGWAQGEVALRQARQMDLEEKRKRADVIIDNSGTLEDLDRQVAEIWQKHVQGA
jgi:dephospho-CoA kinase